MAELIYFNEQGDSALAKAVQNVEPVIQPGDRLSIVVSASNPVSAAPYNLGSSSSTAAPASSSAGGGGYVVEADGTVHLPGLGKVQVSGMKRKQVVDYLSNLLTKFITDPIVTVDILNFKITVLGEVNHQGTFTIPDGKVTIIDAIGLAGDLPLTAHRDNITVIREKNGGREFGKVNLLSKNVFASPYFVLQQNDIVYVEMTKAKVGEGGQTLAKNISIITSVISVLTTITLLLTNAFKK